jgi:Na+/melibiose symporter-like transporter
MQKQNFKNHGRYVPLYHYGAAILIIATLFGSIISILHADAHTHYAAVTLLCVSLVLVILYWYARAFALRAQDRAIRAEENFRHYLLTGKPLDSRLRMTQIIALRFAPDEEFPSLAKKAAEENMTMKEIKMAIKNWRADHNRV